MGTNKLRLLKYAYHGIYYAYMVVWNRHQSIFIGDGFKTIYIPISGLYNYQIWLISSDF